MMLNQVYTKNISENRLSVFIKTNHFKAGEIDFSKNTFYSVPRSHKNVMQLFGGGSLGINEEILLHFNFTYIKILFNEKVLTTTKEKWQKLGVKSPFCNEKVDRQILLSLKHINLEPIDDKPEQLFSNQENHTESELNLFAGAAL